MININQELLNNLISKAKLSPRKRMNYNFHNEDADPLQRMLNAMEPGTYVQPHKHENPDKREAFWVLTGKFIVFEFDDFGRITEHTILDAKAQNFGCEINPRVWHSILPLETGTVAYEVKDGPYVVAIDKNFAPWAPNENSLERFEYVRKLFNEVNIEVPDAYLV
ncbi:MAG: WbuC family cupin fold metalloprotein [Bacteroidota bacterium]